MKLDRKHQARHTVTVHIQSCDSWWQANGDAVHCIADTSGTLRAALYVRMSTEHQQYSPENQTEVIRQYAAAHRMEIVREYADHGRSGLNIAGLKGSIL